MSLLLLKLRLIKRNLVAFLLFGLGLSTGLTGCAALRVIRDGIKEMNKAAGDSTADLERDLEKAVRQ